MGTYGFPLSRPYMLWTMLEPGTPLPEFTAVDDDGNPTSSADWHGKWTVLWWYVKADTAG